MTNRNLVLRDKNGAPHPDLWRIDKHNGEIFIDDAVGFVSGATPAAQQVKAAPVKIGQLYGIQHDAGLTTEDVATAAGQFEVTRPGDYAVVAGGTVLGGNASAIKIEVFLNGAVIADSAGNPGGSVRAEVVMPAAAVQSSFVIPRSRLRSLKRGDLIDLRVTGSVGTVTIKQLRFGLEQVGDLDNPALD